MKTVNLVLSVDEAKTILERLDGLPIKSQKANSRLYLKIKRALEKKPIKISSRKAKGRNLQKEICRKIADMLKIEYDQQDDRCLIHSREMGQAGSDIILRGDVYDRFPFSVECKATEQIALPSFMEQAKQNTKADQFPLVVIKNKKLPPTVVMEWETFEVLFQRGFQ